jgi:acyl-CoA synthetase (AMP-forming)/AMP-acid ligase II
VEVRLVCPDTGAVLADEGDACRPGGGLLEVRGPGVFREYWGRPEATAAEFCPAEDGRGDWFKTGDVAQRDARTGAFSILGRQSVDIIKSGGYKLSALDIERVLLQHDAVREAAVIGVEDDEWGERVAAVLAFEPGRDGETLETLRAWCKGRIATYKMPTVLVPVDALERNAMGKVNKKALKASLFPAGERPTAAA